MTLPHKSTKDTKITKGRKDTKRAILQLPTALAKQLRMLAIDRETTLSAVATDVLSRHFAELDKPVVKKEKRAS